VGSYGFTAQERLTQAFVSGGQKIQAQSQARAQSRKCVAPQKSRTGWAQYQAGRKRFNAAGRSIQTLAYDNTFEYFPGGMAIRQSDYTKALGYWTSGRKQLAKALYVARSPKYMPDNYGQREADYKACVAANAAAGVTTDVVPTAQDYEASGAPSAPTAFVDPGFMTGDEAFGGEEIVESGDGVSAEEGFEWSTGKIIAGLVGLVALIGGASYFVMQGEKKDEKKKSNPYVKLNRKHKAKRRGKRSKRSAA